MEEDAGALGADVSFGKGLKGLVDDGLSAFTVELGGHLNTCLAGADGALGAGVEVTESTAAHGGGLAMESAGHEVTTFGVHGVLSGDRLRHYPSPTH
jgi:hypothetical protein